MPKLILAYWDIRGLAQPARTLLEYGGIDYEDKRYKVTGEAPNYDITSWTSEKYKLGLDFPNLPYLVDGDVKMSESWAIYRYIAKKAGVFPSTEKELYECDMVEGVIGSFRGTFVGMCYNPDCENMKVKVRETQQAKLKQFESFLQGRKFLAGNKLTYVDFAFYEILDHHRLLFTDILDDFPNIREFMKRFENIERIAAYFKSDRFRKFPVNNKMALWGGGSQ